MLILVVRYALRNAPPSVDQQPQTIEPTKLEPRQAALPDLPSSDVPPAETPVSQPQESTATNAAALYRQAFALYDALSKDEKGLLVDWRTNVDASVEAELCEKMRPICNIMHQATAVTNCDWGIEPLTFDSRLPHLNPARGISRAAIWNAAHCRQNDASGASEDVLSTLQLGRSVSSSALIGSLVDVAIQGIAETYVAANIGLFRGAEGKRLSASFSDSIYEEEPSRAMEQEASMVENSVPKLVSMPPEELEKNLSQLLDGQNVPEMDRAALLASFQQTADSQRALAKALASGSADEYEAWQQSSAELQNSNPVAKGFLAAYDRVVDKWERGAVNRALVVAGLAVAEEGASVLQSHPDPSNGQPFVYTETSDGFELQSGFKTNGVPLKMQFK